MIRKLIALLCFLVLLFPSALAEEEVNFDVEDEVDITELVQIAEETAAKEKKDSDGAYIMTVTCTGDFTIGDNHHRKKSFASELKKHDGDINFIMQNVRGLFLEDDLTIVNFEGTLTPDTTSAPKDKKNNEFLFSIDPQYVTVLPDNGVEAVSLDNNHVWDYGEQGLEDTKAALAGAGVLYSTPTEPCTWTYKDQVEVVMLSYNCIDRYGSGFKKEKFRREYSESFLQYDTFEEAVCADIAAAKEVYPLVIVSFHWGIEKMYTPTENQTRLGRMAVSAGADLVIGNHSHRFQPVEHYTDEEGHEGFICYSLGNFCFAGNDKPSDMTSILFQIRYRVKDGNVSYKDYRVIPIRISSKKDANNFIPMILEDEYSRDSVLSVLRENSKVLPYAVTDFPLTFQ